MLNQFLILMTSLLAEGDEVNLEMQEIAEDNNIKSKHLPKGLIK